jgi:hypothetical protein
MTTDIVRFSHETVREFADSKNFSSFELAESCLTFLGFTDFDQPCDDDGFAAKRINAYAFGQYAAEHWAIHSGNVKDKDTIDTLLSNTFRSEARLESMEQINNLFYTRHYGILNGKPLLHIAAQWGLATCANWC